MTKTSNVSFRNGDAVRKLLLRISCDLQELILESVLSNELNEFTYEFTKIYQKAKSENKNILKTSISLIGIN